MNILYLHGLMSTNKSQKTEWLKETHSVFNPALNYKEDSKTIFNDLELLCKQHEIDLVIGSSMGGYLAYHLSQKFNIPSLLFNPALEKNSIEKPPVDLVENLTIKHTIVLGEKDEVVGHRTPFEVFKKHFLRHTTS